MNKKADETPIIILIIGLFVLLGLYLYFEFNVIPIQINQCDNLCGGEFFLVNDYISGRNIYCVCEDIDRTRIYKMD